MGMKIKFNDDRIKATAAAVLLIGRTRLGRGEEGPWIGDAFADFRAEPEAFKAAFPKRELAEARDLAVLVEVVKQPRRREHYERLIAAVDVMLARIERNKTQFSSLVELDNFFAFNLKTFE